MEESHSPLITSADPPEQHLWRSNRPILRERFMEAMERKGTELQEDLEVDPIPVGMAYDLWLSMQFQVSPGELKATLGTDGIRETEEQNSGDEVWNLLAGLDSKQDIVEELKSEKTRHQFLSGLAAEGDEFQERNMIEYKALTPIDIGFILKSRRFTLCKPPEVMKKQTA